MLAEEVLTRQGGRCSGRGERWGAVGMGVDPKNGKRGATLESWACGAAYVHVEWVQCKDEM